MATFLTTNGISYNIEKIIQEAQSELILISPYLQISKTFFERLKDASERGVKIIIVYGKDKLRPNERNSLASLKKLQLYSFENLHAKCYFNQNNMVITSMNMYEFSEKNNREMGVLISLPEDKELYEKASDEYNSIKQSSEVIELTKSERKFSAKDSNMVDHQNKPKRGYCIRCGKSIPYNVDKPMCWDCFTEWEIYENYDYLEVHCHRCGEFTETTVEKPLCYPCFKAEN